MYSFSNRVRYSEVNSEKELTLPSLLDYLQDCCTFESEDFGVGVDYLAKEQVAWILSSWEIKVYRYPQMGQHIKVSTWPYAFRGFYGYRNFRIEGEDGEIFAEANSVWVFMDTEKMRPARVSERMQEVIYRRSGMKYRENGQIVRSVYRMRQCKKVSKRNRYVFPVFTLIQTII